MKWWFQPTSPWIVCGLERILIQRVRIFSNFASENDSVFVGIVSKVVCDKFSQNVMDLPWQDLDVQLALSFHVALKECSISGNFSIGDIMDAEPQMEMAASPSLWEQAMLTVHLSFQELQQEVPEQLSRRCLEKRYSEELKAEGFWALRLQKWVKISTIVTVESGSKLWFLPSWLIKYWEIFKQIPFEWLFSWPIAKVTFRTKKTSILFQTCFPSRRSSVKDIS